MGTFAQLQFRDGAWVEQVGVEADRLAHDPEALSIEIHDSDIAGLQWPSDRGRGLLYLGHQPRHYFEDEDASPELDVSDEAAGLAAWASRTTGTDVDPAEVEACAAVDSDTVRPDVFVEETLVRLLPLLGVPLPPMLTT